MFYFKSIKLETFKITILGHFFRKITQNSEFRKHVFKNTILKLAKLISINAQLYGGKTIF